MTKLDRILKDLKTDKIKQKDAKQKILDLFVVSSLFCKNCHSDNLIDYETHWIRCLDCDAIYKK